MSRSARYGAAGEHEAQRAWRLLVELVMETRGEWRRKVSEATGLPFSRARALWRLERGPLTLSELAQDMGTDAPAATVLINALEERGLVKREAHPTDGRAKQVSLTAAGRRMLAAVAAITDQPPPGFAELPHAELAALRRTLEKLVTEPVKRKKGQTGVV
jgi:DNA-binding MarR family transcriptional regulator